LRHEKWNNNLLLSIIHGCFLKRQEIDDILIWFRRNVFKKWIRNMKVDVIEEKWELVPRILPEIFNHKFFKGYGPTGRWVAVPDNTRGWMGMMRIFALSTLVMSSYSRCHP